MAALKPYEQVYGLVRRIPCGQMLTYGIISDLLDGRLSPAGVGWALRALSGKDLSVPWHRVINSKGQLSTDKNADIPPGLQRELLESEGVWFDANATLDLKKYLWTGLFE